MNYKRKKVKITNNFTTSIHLVLKELIEEKSKRDQIKFTSSQLANALCMPRSMITKLTHPDLSKRVLNPRVDTLLKIVEFFRKDGFSITIDDLLGTKIGTSIDVQSQQVLSKSVSRKIPLYSFEGKTNKKLGTVDVKIPSHSKNVFALYADEDIKPFFKKGSIFIINEDENLEDDTLIAISFKKQEKFAVKKFHIEGTKRILKSLDYHEKQIILMPTTQCEIAGVVIQVNAKV